MISIYVTVIILFHLIHYRDQPYLIRYCLPGIMPQPRTLSSDSDAEQIVNRIHESGTLQLYVEGRPGFNINLTLKINYCFFLFSYF